MKSNEAQLTEALKHVDQLFFREMKCEATAFLFGSGATGNWTSARSDLDLLMFIKQSQLHQFQDQLQAWKKLNLPKIDGFLCAEDTDLAGQN